MHKLNFISKRQRKKREGKGSGTDSIGWKGREGVAGWMKKRVQNGKEEQGNGQNSKVKKGSQGMEGTGE